MRIVGSTVESPCKHEPEHQDQVRYWRVTRRVRSWRRDFHTRNGVSLSWDLRTTVMNQSTSCHTLVPRPSLRPSEVRL